MTEARRPVSRHVLHPCVDHGMFVLRDPLHPESPRSAGVPALDDILMPAAGGVILGSAGDAFYPDVTVEFWDDEPPPREDEWDEVDEAQFTAPTGEIRLEETMGAPVEPPLPPMPPGPIRIRAHCRGRGKASERLGVQLYYRGVEEWLLQLWPGRGPGGSASALRSTAPPSG